MYSVFHTSITKGVKEGKKARKMEGSMKGWKIVKSGLYKASNYLRYYLKIIAPLMCLSLGKRIKVSSGVSLMGPYATLLGMGIVGARALAISEKGEYQPKLECPQGDEEGSTNFQMILSGSRSNRKEIIV